MELRKICRDDLIGMLCLGIVWLWSADAYALERGVELKLSVQEEYNDNIFFSTRNEIEDYITTVSAGLTIYNRTERSNIDLSARGDRLTYEDQDELDTIDQFYSGKMDHVFTPRWQAGVNGGFTRDSRTDRDLETTGLVLGTTERDRSNGGLFTTFQATEKTDMTLSYSYMDEDYEDAGLSDVISQQAGLGFKHNWSKVLENAYLQLDGSYRHYEYDTADIRLYSGTLGLVKNISELWRLSLSGGARYQASEFRSGETAVLSDDKWGGVGHAGLDYQGERGRFGLSAQHDVTPSSGLDGTTERSTLGVDMYYRVAQKSGVGLDLRYHINKADKGQLATQDVDNQTWQVSPYINLSLLDDLYLIARYRYSQVENRISYTTANRSYAILQLSYTLTLWD